jgi:hypothetical protein
MEFIDILKQFECLTMCSYCQRGIKLNDKWIYLDVSFASKVYKLNNISHGICSICLTKQMDYLQQQIDKMSDKEDSKW